MSDNDSFTNTGSNDTSEHAEPFAAAQGAFIETSYMVRQQRAIPVFENDLKDIKEFDGLQQGLFGVGVFFISGAMWLGVEDLTQQEGPLKLTATLLTCGVSIIAGAIFCIAGYVMWRMKSRKIETIFQQIKPSQD